MRKDLNRPENTVIYMEVYGINRVIYRVTAAAAKRRGKTVTVYGVSLEDIRTGQCEHLENFSEDIESALSFANDLVHKRIRPDQLYNEALRHLRFSPGFILPLK